MADSAVARLRGILAATLTGAAIDQLLGEARAEWAEMWQPLPTTQAPAGASDFEAALSMTLRQATREQQSAIVAAEPARCCMCGSDDVRYRNYREQPFCWPCADGTSPEGKAAVAASLADDVPRPAPPRDPNLGLCGQRAQLPTGEAVHCTKAAGHTGPWHKHGPHHWRTIFGKPGQRRELFTGRSAHELGELRVTTRDLGDVLRQIIAASAGGCACGGIAGAALVDLGREVTADA